MRVWTTGWMNEWIEWIIYCILCDKWLCDLRFISGDFNRLVRMWWINGMNDWCEWVNGIYFSVSTDWLINQINCLIVLFFSLIYCSFFIGLCVWFKLSYKLWNWNVKLTNMCISVIFDSISLLCFKWLNNTLCKKSFYSGLMCLISLSVST